MNKKRAVTVAVPHGVTLHHPATRAARSAAVEGGDDDVAVGGAGVFGGEGRDVVKVGAVIEEERLAGVQGAVEDRTVGCVGAGDDADGPVDVGLADAGDDHVVEAVAVGAFGGGVAVGGVGGGDADLVDAEVPGTACGEGAD